MLFIAAATGMLVYKFLKSIANRKQCLSNRLFFQNLASLLSFNIKGGVKNPFVPSNNGTPNWRGFLRIFPNNVKVWYHVVVNVGQFSMQNSKWRLKTLRSSEIQFSERV